MELARVKGICEAVIFAADKPVSMRQLQGVFEDAGVENEEIEAAIAALREELAGEARGLALVEVSGGWAFRTKPDMREWVARLTLPKAVRLSRASMETLAIVAYRQPVTRAGIDDIRGVDSGAVIKGLADKRLIKILGRQEGVGNPLIYGTTKEFLEAFGLKDLSGLPTLKEFQELDDDSKRALDAHGIRVDEPPSAEAMATSAETVAQPEGSARGWGSGGEAPGNSAGGIERTGQVVALSGSDDAEGMQAAAGQEEE